MLTKYVLKWCKIELLRSIIHIDPGHADNRCSKVVRNTVIRNTHRSMPPGHDHKVCSKVEPKVEFLRPIIKIDPGHVDNRCSKVVRYTVIRNTHRSRKLGHADKVFLKWYKGLITNIHKAHRSRPC